MIETAQDWLNDQLSQQRDLLLVIDRLAEPDPIKGLFSADLMQDYVNLYHGTEYTDLADVGPWLVRLTNIDSGFLGALLEAPEQHWGWLASSEHNDLNVIAQHWRERMLDNDVVQPSLYRFQDNRVIGRHLREIPEHQRPLLLGPLVSVLCWSGQAWIAFDNPSPGVYPPPFETPWLNIAESDFVLHEIQRLNLVQWLWQNNSAATSRLAETQVVDTWLDEQIAKARSWKWLSQERLEFLLQYQLEPAFAAHPAWTPQDNETPDAHFARCRSDLVATSPNAWNHHG